MKFLSREKDEKARIARILPAAVALAAVLALAAVPLRSQDRAGDDAVWADFIAWFRTAPADPNPLAAYAAKLSREGVDEMEAGRRLALIVRLFADKPEGVEVFYDRTYSKPLTGRPEEDVPTAPSGFVADAVKGLKPGTALDVGMGQGRNAVYLARRGWEVAGFDISQAGLDAARANAEKAGVRIKAEKASYDGFDFGAERWDLVVVIFAWAPVSDLSFVERIRTSLRPGGRVLFEHFVDAPGERPHAPMVRALKPGELRGHFAGFEVEFYEEADGVGDWGGPGERLVRMIARKRS
jgi:SAM-dependent methyltransferase